MRMYIEMRAISPLVETTLTASTNNLTLIDSYRPLDTKPTRRLRMLESDPLPHDTIHQYPSPYFSVGDLSRIAFNLPFYLMKFIVFFIQCGGYKVVIVDKSSGIKSNQSYFIYCFIPRKINILF